jgi:ribose-phosphate pyrophosphokinase
MSIAETALLFCGSSHPKLGQKLAQELGSPLGAMDLKQFPDGESFVQILENVRGRDTFVLQSIALNPNFFLMELLIIADALRRASARSIVAVIPYFGYSRQDRKDKPRVPITAKLIANLLVEAGVTRLLTIDLHAGQLEGFFDIPVDHLHSRKTLLSGLKNTLHLDMNRERCVVVAPDIGSIKLARRFAKELGTDLAVIEKERISPTTVVETTLIGNISGKDILLTDDICSTATTIVAAAELCRNRGAKRIVAAITHGILVGDALARIEKSPIESLLITDTIPQNSDVTTNCHKQQIVSIAPLLGQAIQAILSNESIQVLS